MCNEEEVCKKCLEYEHPFYSSMICGSPVKKKEEEILQNLYYRCNGMVNKSNIDANDTVKDQISVDMMEIATMEERDDVDRSVGNNDSSNDIEQTINETSAANIDDTQTSYDNSTNTNSLLDDSKVSSLHPFSILKMPYHIYSNDKIDYADNRISLSTMRTDNSLDRYHNKSGEHTNLDGSE